MLLTTGCSVTYGAELDEDNWWSDEHWEKTFSHKLAEKLDIGYTCLAKCGNSNYKIFRDLIQWFNGRLSSSVYDEGARPDNCTHMVVVWSQHSRCEIFSNKSDQLPPSWDGWNDYDDLHLGLIQSNSDCSNINEFIHDDQKVVVDEHKHIVDLLTYMQTIELLCKSNNIKLLQGNMSDGFRRSICKFMSERSSKIGNLYNESLRQMMATLDNESKIEPIMSFSKDRVLTCGHPEKEVHTEYAEYLYNIFQEHFPEGENK